MVNSDRPGSSRKTLGFFANTPHRENYGRLQLHSHNFLDDVRNSIIPYEFGRSRRHPRLGLEPDTAKLRRQLCVVLGGSTRDTARGFPGGVEEVIRDIGYRLAFYSRLYFEICTLSIPDSPRARQALGPMELPTSFQVAVYIPGRVFSLGPVVVQTIPREERASFRRRFVVLVRRSVWTVAIPGDLGGPIGNRIRQGFVEEASSVAPRHIDPEKLSNLGGIGEVLHSYRTYSHELLAASTSRWGWPARHIWADTSTEFYSLHRALKFEASMALLREHVVDSINRLLERIGFESRIATHGLQSAGELSRILVRLDRGEADFDEVLTAIGAA